MIKLKKHTSSIINPNFFTFFFIFHQCFCSDQNYESCVRKDCGDGQNISYPFWINGLQDPTCGYPGFEIRCNINGSPTLQISENKFIIKQIEYKNKKIRLQNAAILSNRSDYCLPKMMNITLDPNRFTIDNNSSRKLILISNCSGNFSVNSEKYKVRSCNDSSRFVVLKSDENLRNVTRNCGGGGEIVEIPVELGSNTMVDGGNYMEVVNQGFVLRWLAADCRQCESSGGRCGFNMTAFQFRCFCTDRSHRMSCNLGSEKKWIVKVVIGVGAALSSIVMICTICYIMKFSPIKYLALFKYTTEDDINVETFIKQYGFLTMKRYNYADVKKMTNSFQVKLGSGGFGTVFEGKLLDGRLVAVKVLNSSRASGQEFINEVASIGRTSHINIVALLGFCSDGQKRALIYEFMPNGSLDKFVYSHAPQTRMHIGVMKLYDIAVGVAQGLDYLHRGCNPRILHLDIKPHNILLDEDFCPKIADFGLAKLYSRNKSIVSMLEARGTIGYIAPEVFNRNFGGVSHKSDVYSYGMLILEMVGGKNNVDVAGMGSVKTNEVYFPDCIYNWLERDDYLLDGISSVEENDLVRKMTIVGLWCIQPVPTERPSIDEVIEMLEGSMAALEIPPKPFFSSPPRPPATTFCASQSEPDSRDQCF